MRILECDESRRIIKFQLETLEDLYFISLIIDPEDTITAWTTRQVRISRGDGSEERGERVRVKLTLSVKKVEFQRFSDVLRVLGVVEEAPEWLYAKGSYHTIGLKVGDEVLLCKQFITKYHKRILELAVTRTKVAGVLSVDFEELATGILRPQGLEIISVIALPRARKEGSIREHLEISLSKHLHSIIKQLEVKNVGQIIAVAPQLVLEVLGEQLHGLKIPVKFLKTTEGGLAGIYELLRDDRFKEMIENLIFSVSREALSELIETIMKSPARAALGIEEVKQALQSNSVKLLLVSDEIFLSDKREEIIGILRSASDVARDIVVIPPYVEGADMLRRFDGIAAILYYDAMFPSNRVR
ncbi:MAG: hypothetical protein QXY49_00035 [Thermofilaceae archaeon]